MQNRGQKYRGVQGEQKARKVAITFTEDQFHRLKKYARQEDVSFAEAVRRCVDGLHNVETSLLYNNPKFCITKA